MKLLKNIGLYLFAALLSIGLAPLALIHTIIDQIRFKSKNRLSDSFRQGAYSLDVYGNTTYYSFLNAYFLEHGGYHFGGADETISSALGKNWTLGKLTLIGEGCAGFLNWIDPDHCYYAIKNVDWLVPMPEPVAWWKSGLFGGILFSLVISLIWIAFQLMF